jgi:uncharacterized membrane protein YdjX (TVP38/TMEM64 family)
MPGSKAVVRTGLRNRLVLVTVLAVVAIVGYVGLRPYLTLEALAKQEGYLRGLYERQPVLISVAAFLIYVVVTGLSLPGATGLTLAYGWFFGLVRGLILVSFASTAGATLAFLLSRYLFRDAVRSRFGDQFTHFDDALRREGPYFLFTLRLIPAVPFFVINAVMGLTPIRTSTFWWLSQLGMLPGTALYIYAGSSVPSLQTLADKGIGAVFAPGQITQLLIAFALLGAFPFVARLLMRHFGHSVSTPPATTEERK